MERVPGELMETLTSGQRAATRMILETSDRFTVVQGYAGVGKTTQFRAVMSAVNMLPASERPRVVGLGPTHRAVGEMRSAGVDAQTLASFCMTRSCSSAAEKRRISATRCSCSMRAQWWAIPTWHGHTP